MLKLYKNIFLFSLPVLAYLLCYPLEERATFVGLKNDCLNRGIWIHDRIIENTNSIDVAFIGSSRTINGIDDRLLSQNMIDNNVVNLGYCRYGRNLSWVILKKLIAYKSPKVIYLEIRTDEERYSHPVFPYLAESKDVLLASPFFNKDLFSDVFIHLKYKNQLIQESYFQNYPTDSLRSNLFGFLPALPNKNSILLPSISKAGDQPRNTALTAVYNQFPKSYLNKIFKLCKQKNVEIKFLFLPSYSRQLWKPSLYQTYSPYGEIITFPEDIFSDSSNWKDENHMNKKGAQALSTNLLKHMNDVSH